MNFFWKIIVEEYKGDWMKNFLAETCREKASKKSCSKKKQSTLLLQAELLSTLNKWLIRKDFGPKQVLWELLECKKINRSSALWFHLIM